MGCRSTCKTYRWVVTADFRTYPSDSHRHGNSIACDSRATAGKAKTGPVARRCNRSRNRRVFRIFSTAGPRSRGLGLSISFPCDGAALQTGRIGPIGCGLREKSRVCPAPSHGVVAPHDRRRDPVFERSWCAARGELGIVLYRRRRFFLFSSEASPGHPICCIRRGI